MESSESQANAWFEDESSDVSSNYGARKDGVIEMYVAEEDTAWAQGRVDRPTAKVVLARPDANPNSYCVSIECEGSGTEPLTVRQKGAIIELIIDISSRRSIPIDRDHVIGHHEIYSKKSCPGVISVTELAQLASAQRAVYNPPRLVYSKYLHDWLVVTRYVSDSEWYYMPLKELTRGTRAQAKLSEMALTDA